MNKEKSIMRAAILSGLIISLMSCKNTEDQHIVEVKEMETQIPITQLKKSKVKMNLNEQVEYSRNNLAQRMGVELGSVEISSAQTVTWRSGALGCPKPGMSYTESLVPGASIFLRVGNTFHAYHSKRDGNPFYCPRERVEQPLLDQTQDVT